MSHDKDVLNRFLINTANHTMKIHRDDGIYRHLEFSRNGSNSYRFDLVTWPGYLCVTGDMGTWTFSRIADMFDFSRPAISGGRKVFLLTLDIGQRNLKRVQVVVGVNRLVSSSMHRPLIAGYSNGLMLISKSVTTMMTLKRSETL